ncbi:MAG: NBR1-Ig-like domain-containing protein [Anaerolineales bacterium]|nr:NBR1-Ig-like domain-containing protein [Anaerolineales bacterium]
MFKRIFLTLITTSILVSACGAQAAQDPYVQTAVALTVAAKNAEQSAPTPTPETVAIATKSPLEFSPTLTLSAPIASATAPVNANANPCAKASLVSETIVDGTIFKPGQKFTKTWEIKNTSSCAWNTSYKIVFWDGDILGGGYVYNLPQNVPPQGVVSISLVLTAPTVDGSYKSKWALQTPDGVNFGVGDYSAPFYAEIVVSSSSKPAYAVTSVTYQMTREPATGCPANINYIAYATVTTNGPLEFKYYWVQSDGHNIYNKELIKMEAAGSVVLSNSWKLNLASNAVTRWMALAIGISDGEYYQFTEYPHVEFTKTCGG